MIFTSGNNVVEYSILTKDDTHPEELNLLFSTGKAEDIVYITSIEMAESNMKELTSTLHAFCTALNTQRIVYSLMSTTSSASATITRYALQSEGFRSFTRFVDDAKAAVFMFWNAEANEVFTRLFDEYIGFELHDVVCCIANGDNSRADRILDALGAADADALLKYISLYLSRTSAPQKIEI